jgi:hypothetical protein
MKTLERMTNPCFQDTDFATVMKGKHVMNTWDETLVESIGEVSGSEKESVNDEENDELNPGSDNGSVNDEVNTTNDPMANLLSHETQSNGPIANLLSQSTQVPGRRISASLQGGTQVEVALHSSAQRRPWGEVGMADYSRECQNSTRGQHTRKRWPTPDSQNLRHGKQIRRLELHHQVLVVLRTMITICQWSILPSSSPLESQEKNGTVHLEIQWTFSHTSITSTLDLNKRC